MKEGGPEVANEFIPTMIKEKVGLDVCTKFGHSMSDCSKLFVIRCLYKDSQGQLLSDVFGPFINVHERIAICYFFHQVNAFASN